MQVLVIINPKAGTANVESLQKKIEDALFRCELKFCIPKSKSDLAQFAGQELRQFDYILICGGDGTIHWTLNALIHTLDQNELPPICLIRSGTANDLASHLSVSQKINKAARCILEGDIQKIDLIELESDQGEKSVMVTNGGIGIPALIADDSNRLRSYLSQFSETSRHSPLTQFLASSGQQFLRTIGASVYLMSAAEALRKWTPSDWEVELELNGGDSILTKASSVLVSNQPRIGKNLISARYTSNNDGVMNIMVTEALSIREQVSALYGFMNGTVHEQAMNRSFEVTRAVFKSRGKRGMTFFGDGEIIFREAREIKITCKHQGLSIVVDQRNDQ